MLTEKEKSNVWFETDFSFSLYLPFEQKTKRPRRKWALPPPPWPRKRSIIEWPCDGYWPTHCSGKDWTATMCYTRLHSWPWLAIQTSTAMISPRTGLQKDCHATAVTIVCYCHHDLCGLHFHSVHAPVFLCLYTLPPSFFATNASFAKGALLGEHPP